VSEWVSEFCLTSSSEQFFGYIMARTSYVSIRWWCLLWTIDQHTELDFYYSVISPKQQCAGRHVALLGHLILIPTSIYPRLLVISCMLSGEAANTYFIVFGLTRPAIYCTLTIIPQMGLIIRGISSRRYIRYGIEYILINEIIWGKKWFSDFLNLSKLISDKWSMFFLDGVINLGFYSQKMTCKHVWFINHRIIKLINSRSENKMSCTYYVSPPFFF